MLISVLTDCQQNKVKLLVKIGTLVYNGKVNQGKDKSNLPGCIYLNLIIMTKQEAQQLLQKSVDLHQEMEDMRMEGNGDWCEQHTNAVLAAQDVLEWFKQEEKSYCSS